MLDPEFLKLLVADPTPEQVQAVVDYISSGDGEELMAKNGGVFPLNTKELSHWIVANRSFICAATEAKRQARGS